MSVNLHHNFIFKTNQLPNLLLILAWFTIVDKIRHVGIALSQDGWHVKKGAKPKNMAGDGRDFLMVSLLAINFVGVGNFSMIWLWFKLR